MKIQARTSAAELASATEPGPCRRIDRAPSVRRWDPSSVDDHVPPTTPTFVPPDRQSALHHACTAPIRSDGCDRAARTKVSGLARHPTILSGFSPASTLYPAGKTRNICSIATRVYVTLVLRFFLLFKRSFQIFRFLLLNIRKAKDPVAVTLRIASGIIIQS